MIVGFTGTRKGMNERQLDQLATMLQCFAQSGIGTTDDAKNVLFSLQLPIELLEQVKQAAAAKDMSVSAAAREGLRLWLAAEGEPDGRNEFHFGGAPGADLEARKVAKPFAYGINWHPSPGVDMSALAAAGYAPLDVLMAETWHEVFPPLVRNHHIVDAAQVLVAAPHTDREELRSGTWATIRYARIKGIPVVMLTRGAA